MPPQHSTTGVEGCALGMTFYDLSWLKQASPSLRPLALPCHHVMPGHSRTGCITLARLALVQACSRVTGSCRKPPLQCAPCPRVMDRLRLCGTHQLCRREPATSSKGRVQHMPPPMCLLDLWRGLGLHSPWNSASPLFVLVAQHHRAALASTVNLWAPIIAAQLPGCRALT